MIKAILFDVDGTLVDTNDLHASAWQQAFAHFGIDIPFDEVRGKVGMGGDNLIPSLLPGITDERREGIDSFRSELFKRDYLPRARPFPGVRALFERIHADGRTIVLASSAKGAEVDFHLDLLDVRELVSVATSADDVEHSKPCGDIFAAALAKADHLSASEAVVIGDSPYDIVAAKRLGIRAIGMRSGGFGDGRLREAGADALYDDPEDLLGGYDESLINRG